MKSAIASTETRSVPAAEFKAKCLQFIQNAHEERKDVVITKRGVPMARLVPYEQPEIPFKPVWGRTPNVKVLGDIISPLPQELTLPEYAWDKKPANGKEKGKGKKKR